MAGFGFSRQRLPSKASVSLRQQVNKHPFLFFGLPFLLVVVSGSFFLTPITANRYDTFDRRRRYAEKQDAFDTSGVKRRKFDAREEYYVCSVSFLVNFDFRATAQRTLKEVTMY